MKYPQFIIYKNTDRQFYFRMYNDKGKLLLTGEPNQLRFGCINEIRQLYAIVEGDFNYRISKGQHFYFQITNSENKLIATSEAFRTMPGMAYGLNAVKKNVPVAVIEDYSRRVRFFSK